MTAMFIWTIQDVVDFVVLGFILFVLAVWGVLVLAEKAEAKLRSLWSRIK